MEMQVCVCDSASFVVLECVPVFVLSGPALFPVSMF